MVLGRRHHADEGPSDIRSTSSNSDDLIVNNYELNEFSDNKHDFDKSGSPDENVVEYFEKDNINIDERVQSGNSQTEHQEDAQQGLFHRFVESFKRAEDHHTPQEDLENDLTTAVSPSSMDGVKRAAPRANGQMKKNEEEGLKKTIKPRHVVMISLGTGIGTGLLVGNAKALHNAGPAGLVIGYAIMGSCLYCIIQAAGEMAVVYSNLLGGFNTYPSMLVDPAFGFSVAWVYCLQWLCVCPLELVTASLTIKYWTTSVDPDVFVVIFYVLIIAINTFGARGYAEAEFFFNCCKIMMMIGFFILGIVITTGGAGKDGYLGGTYWHNPGAFRGTNGIQRFKGIMATFVTAAFAFGATEFIALTAAEQSNPRKAIPSAAKKVLYRIICIFIGSITLLGFLVPWDSDQLMGAGGSATKASPYVLAASLHGVRVVPHFINAVILISVVSVGNSAFYSSSRLLLSLSQQGYAPKFFDYVDREGRPLRAMMCSALFGVIAFCATSPKEDQVFTWLLAISGLSQLFTWIAICVSHMRFRRAMRVQGRSLGEIGFKSQVGVYGSFYATVMMVLALIAQFWVAIAPIGEGGSLDAQGFFENYLAMPILIAFYCGYKVWKRDWRLFIRSKDIDLDSYRQIFDEELLKQEDEEYQEKLRNGPFWKRVVDFWC
ncbi:High-affinity glutamine permease [Nakaseomyces bracarensis]|uniref:High-affinity glutamine permease n=1 Tax=Nakaseomyces bracarensis TaxID=273131 RepID=A0ABR4NQC2_9SACH